MTKDVVFDLDQIKVIERLLSFVTEEGITNLKVSDIQDFLKFGKKLIYKTAVIKSATKEDIEKSGLLCDELHQAHKYFVNVESGNDMSLENLDTIYKTFRDFEERTKFSFSSRIDEYRTDFLIELFIIE